MRASIFFKKLRVKKAIMEQALEEFKTVSELEDGVRGIVYKERVQTSTQGDLSDLLGKKEEMLRDLETKKKDYLDYRQKVIEAIHNLEDEMEIEILYKKNIQGLTYQELEEITGLSRSWLKQQNRKACENLEKNILKD